MPTTKPAPKEYPVSFADEDVAAIISTSAPADTFATLPLASITPSLTNPRKHFNPAKLQELADSIQASGVHQPVLVRPLPGSRVPGTPKAVQYELVAGERRYRASQLAGATTIPALIRPLNDAQALEVQLIENLQRSDLSELEEAEGYKALMDATATTREQVATKIGKSKSYVNARLRLLALCQEARQALAQGTIDASRALEIARIPHHDLQLKALKEATATNSYDNQPRHSARSFQQWLRTNVMLRLEHAPFNITDARLVEAAGSCKQCPRRTGADPDIFADVLATDGGADICTDLPCYRAKESAHQARLLAQAEAKGMRVISGAEAEDLHDWQDDFDGYTPLNQLREDTATGEPQRLHQLLDDSALKTLQPVLIEHPQSKRLFEMVPTDETEALLLARGLVKAEEAPKAPAAKRRQPTEKELLEQLEGVTRRFKSNSARAEGIAMHKATTSALHALPADQLSTVHMFGPTVLRAWLLSFVGILYGTEAYNQLTNANITKKDNDDAQEAARQHIERSPAPELVRMAAVSLLMAADDHADDGNHMPTEMAKLLKIDTVKLFKQDKSLNGLRAAHTEETKRINEELAAVRAKAAAAKPATPSPEGPAAPAGDGGGGKAKRPGENKKAAPRRPSGSLTHPPKLSEQEAKAGIAAAMQGIEAPPADGAGGAAQAAGTGPASATAVKPLSAYKVGEQVAIQPKLGSFLRPAVEMWSGRVGTVKQTCQRKDGIVYLEVTFKGKGGGIGDFLAGEIAQ